MAQGEAARGSEPARSAVDFLSQAVARHFKVHHIEGDRFRLAFFTRETAQGAKVETDSPVVDRAFEALRVEIKPQSYVATLQLVGEDGILTVSRVVDPNFRSGRVNWAFFILTLLSVQAAGADGWASYISPRGPTGLEPFVDWLSPEAQLGGLLYFTIPLMAILGLHEMGHFFTARRYHVRASLPFFIPSLPPLGTFGAFISMRDPLPSRKVIFDIGISGPMVGFAASIGVTVVGALLMFAHPAPARPEVGGNFTLGTPLLFDWILQVVGTPENSYMHPTIFAGWAGFLVTAFNLIPAAQLDGGHVFFSLIRNGPKRESRAVLISAAAVLGIAVLGVLVGYNGWLLLLVIVFLTIRHPPPLNQISALGWKRLAAGVGALLVFAVSFSPAPIQFINGDYNFGVHAPDAPVQVPAGGFANYSFSLENFGNAYNDLEVKVANATSPFHARFGADNTSLVVLTNLVEYQNVSVNITVEAEGREAGVPGAVYLTIAPVGDASLVKSLAFYTITVPAHPELNATASPVLNASAGNLSAVPLRFENGGDVPLNLTLNASALSANWSAGFGALGVYNTTVRVDPGENVTVEFLVSVSTQAAPGDSATFEVDAADPGWPAVAAALQVEVRVGT